MRPLPRRALTVAPSALVGALLAGCAFPHPDTLARAGVPAPVAEACAPLPRSTPAAEGVDSAALAALVEGARATDSDALIVLRRGRVVGEWTFGEPADRRHDVQSITKSVTSLAVGAAVGRGLLRGADQPTAELLPAWQAGAAAGVTLGDLLGHTSGLGRSRMGSVALYFKRDALGYVTGLPLAEPPRTRWQYSNNGVMLLSGAVERAAGEPLAAFAREALFDPLCIRDAAWSGDRKGHTFGGSDLKLRPIDLAKLGQLTLDGGRWRGRQVVPEAWVAAAVARDGVDSVGLAHTSYRYLWTVGTRGDSVRLDSAFVARLRAAGADSALVAWTAARATGWRPWWPVRRALDSLYGPERGVPGFLAASRGVEPLRRWGPAWRWGHDGDLGQYLLVYPDADLVVVRTRRSTTWRTLRGDRSKGFSALYDLSARLAAATVRRDREARAAAGI